MRSTRLATFFLLVAQNWMPLLAGLVGIVTVAALASCNPIHAQQVPVAPVAPQPVPILAANYSGQAFDGWRRTVVDVAPPLAVGLTSDGRTYVVGHSFGVGLHVVDVQVGLDPNTSRTVKLTGEPSKWMRAAPPADPFAFFGGKPAVAGVELQPVSIEVDGAGYAAHFRSRIGPMLVAEVWAQWYPDQPGWCSAEATVTASNPSIPDVLATVPAGFALTWGSGVVVVAGTSSNVLAGESETLADGQSRSMPVTIVWPTRLRAATEWTSAGAAVAQAIALQGCANVWPLGNPTSGTDAGAWTRANFGTTFSHLHDFVAGPLGVNAASSDTGAQEDEVFVGAECATNSPGAITVRYLTALRQAARPCHHLEADGSGLNLAAHPQLVFWDSRPHWSRGVSPDQLGKSRSLTTLDTHGWWGPDVEHAFNDTLFVSARLTGSDALQFDAECIARAYLLQWTVKTGLSTSQCYADRARGWEALLVVNEWNTLRDRTLATAVRDRLRARLDTIILPQLAGRDIGDVRVDDPRLGAGPWWIPWQASVGAYFTDLAGRTFGWPDARAMALRHARKVVADAWILQNGRWKSRAQESVDGTQGQLDESFNLFGMPLAPATVLIADPADAKSRAIWQQLQADAHGGSKWFPPEVVLR